MSLYKKRLYKFTPWLVKALIPSNVKGTYILYKKVSEEYKPVYIGRSDTNLQRRLMQHPLLAGATYFEYSILDSVEKCFIAESSLYHIIKDEIINQNMIHPAKPKHSSLLCPFCQSNMNVAKTNRIRAIS